MSEGVTDSSNITAHSVIVLAARSLAKAQSGVDDWDALDKELQETLIDEVRAVVIALRDAAGLLASDGSQAAQDRVLDLGTRDAEMVFAAMLDAALFN